MRFRISNQPALLDLGRVHETAEVWLNDYHLGVQWWGQRRLDVSGALPDGENHLKIKVSTLLYNKTRSMKNTPTAQLWHNRCKNKDPLPAGLLGPVYLRNKMS